MVAKAEPKKDKEFWHCISDIGTEVDIATDTLISGVLEKESGNKTGRFRDITGKQNNKLTVLAFDSYCSDGKVKWLCQCECGNTRVVRAASFNKGTSSSCGCSRNKPVKDCKELIGKKFGRWTVLGRDYSKQLTNIYLRCVCECTPNIVHSVAYTALKLGLSTSCGCYSAELQRDLHIKDLVGQRFGKVVVDSYAGIENNNAMWNCTCDCGNKCVKSSVTLQNGFESSCGECPKEDLVGKKFGDLTVIRYSHKANAHHYWVCKCNCGNDADVICTTSALTQGLATSCGHKQRPNLVGNKYGKLTVIEFSHSDGKHRFWKCKCDCPKGTEVIVRGSDLSTGKVRSCGCLHVAYYGSAAENEIKDYISSITSFEPVKSRILDRKEIDMYYEDLGIGIEFNGSVYHASNKSLFSDSSIKLKNYHRDKFLLAKKLGIHLVTIFDVDWENNKERIKSYLYDLFYKDKSILMARKCTVSILNKKCAWEFTDKYHIQGYSRLSQINYGLFYEEELVSVMSFGKVRLKSSEEGEYELHRYCVKTGYSVLGGANKLLKAFERDYNPKYIRSYSDNDYFTGDIYNKLGFSCVGQVNQRYYWFYNNREFKREECQLKYLKTKYPDLYAEALAKNVNNKEDFIMTSLGAYKVYRCGNTKWEKT